jgi:hypothetical protein
LIVYQASKRQFIHDTFHDDIEFVLSQQYLRSTGRQPAPAEVDAGRHSLHWMVEVLGCSYTSSQAVRRSLRSITRPHQNQNIAIRFLIQRKD